MMKQAGFWGVMGLTLMLAAAPARAQDAAVCSTTALADAVIAGSASGDGLVVAVAQSVPADPENCVPAYCVASIDETDDVKVAVGAGLSEAYARLIAQGSNNAAASVLGGACAAGCDEVVLTAFAASQSASVSGLCETILGAPGGVAPSILIINAGSGAGGGQSASGN